MILNDIENIVNNGGDHTYDSYLAPKEIKDALEESMWNLVQTDQQGLEMWLTFQHEGSDQSVTFYCEGYTGETILESHEDN
jgi:hypothetical protein